MHMESCREVGPETACISLLMTSLVRFQQMELHVGIALKEELFNEFLMLSELFRIYRISISARAPFYRMECKGSKAVMIKKRHT